MANLAQIEDHSSKVAANVRTLAAYGRRDPRETITDEPAEAGPDKPLLLADVPEEAHHARRSILAHLSHLQALLEQPADFLQRLARQYQVLACIPLEGSVPISDVAALLGVPESQLARVAQMTVTENFLCLPRPGHLAHTSLSANFVADPGLMDAALFLSETAAPAASHMAAATRRWGVSSKANETAYNLAFDTSTMLSNACDQRPRLRRQWPEYLRYGMGDIEAGVTDVLTQLDWRSLGTATVVDSAATSTAMAMKLADLHPPLCFVVQMSSSADLNGTPGSHHRITVQQRMPGAPQLVRDAALFIVRLQATCASAVSSRIRAELGAHVGILRANPRSRLLLVLPSVLRDNQQQQPGGGASPEIEAMARMRDLAFWQLANEREMEMATLLDLVNGVRDGLGRLMVVNKFGARNHPAVAIEVRYQTYDETELP
ncbi:hypothetical protein DL764_000351 [Monosporascus ibericus]|uniref:O-methyltransferase domain-containing protein n=1 Tax=Monosporascus ibericus TaxID=155417 RepID=A0A4Q4TTT4_9PEZI|nr:hypothetical protein DL764_000351 [Monosporascus ibericus]